MLKTVPAVRGLADPLTNAMVDVYLASQVIPAGSKSFIRALCNALDFKKENIPGALHARRSAPLRVLSS